MPQVAPAIIAALITSGTAIGVTGLELANQPGAPKSQGPDPATITQNAIQQETQGRATAAKEAAQFLPGLQASTSGGLSPDAYRDLSATFSGNANLANTGQFQDLIAKFLGLDTGASFGGSNPFGGGSSNPASPGLVTA